MVLPPSALSSTLLLLDDDDDDDDPEKSREVEEEKEFIFIANQRKGINRLRQRKYIRDGNKGRADNRVIYQ